MPGSAENQELGCSSGRGAILWRTDLLRGSGMLGENGQAPFPEPEFVPLGLPKCRLGNATYYPSLEDHCNLQTLE